MATSWRQIVVSPEITIEDALKVIDAGGLRIALVVSNDGRLLGTLSDGDIRRALISRVPLTEKISKAMNHNPRVASESERQDKIRSLMETNDVLIVPLVDRDGRLVGVHNLKDLLEPRRKDNPVFLMAGGFGMRLRPLTHDVPKPMLKLGDKPILENTIESFINAGFHQFFISVHYLADTIKCHFGDGSKWGVEIDYIEEDRPLGTAGALGLLPPLQNLPMIMMNGDLVTRVDFRALLNFHSDNKSAMTMCVRECEVQVPYGVVEAKEHRVRTVVEKPVHKFLVNAGIYVLSPDVVSHVPKNTKLDMPDFVGVLLSAGREVTIFPLHEYWRDIGQFDDFNRAVSDAS